MRSSVWPDAATIWGVDVVEASALVTATPGTISDATAAARGTRNARATRRSFPQKTCVVKPASGIISQYGGCATEPHLTQCTARQCSPSVSGAAARHPRGPAGFAVYCLPAVDRLRHAPCLHRKQRWRRRHQRGSAAVPLDSEGEDGSSMVSPLTLRWLPATRPLSCVKLSMRERPQGRAN